MQHLWSVRTRGAALAVVAALAGVAGVSSGAAAEDTAVVTVPGTVAVVVVDDGTPDSGPVTFVPGGGVELPETDNRIVVNTDAGVVSLTAAQADGLVNGQHVQVVLEADGDASRAEAVAAVATGGAELLTVRPTEDAGSAESGLQALEWPIGAHTITVLPVYWATKPLGTTTAQLTTMANESAAYWAAESGGDMTVTTSVRAPVQIAAQECFTDPGLDALYAKALVAHGFSASYQPGNKEHLVVYFPTSCEDPEDPEGGTWLGMAELGTGKVWVNGEPTAEVLAHEIGHNLGLGHANSFECYSGAIEQPQYLVPLSDNCWYTEYGDGGDLMGGATYERFPPGHLNTGLAATLSFAYSLAPTPYMHTQTIVPTSETGGIEGFAPWQSFQSSDTLVVSYRPLTGRDAVREPARAGVQVHYVSADQWGTPLSFLLEMNAPRQTPSLYPMAEGARYTFAVNGATVQVLDVTPTGADVRLIPSAGFGDVAFDHPFQGDISWMYYTGISTGYWGPSSPTYRPTEPVTRQAMAAFLHRADRYRNPDDPTFVPPVTSPFRDVTTGHPFYADIAWMADEGISTGTVTSSGAYYKPNASVSREAMAAFLYRAAGSPAFTPPATSPFADVSTSHPFYAAIAWMAATGISTGTPTSSGTYYKPGAPVSRAAMAAFLFRFDTLMTAD